MNIYIDFDVIFYEETDVDTGDTIFLPYLDRINQLVGHNFRLWITDNKISLPEIMELIDKWKINVSGVSLGKPLYDIIIDSKSIQPFYFFK